MSRVLKFKVLTLLIIVGSCNYPTGIIYKEIKLKDGVFINKKTFDKKGNLIKEELLNKDSINEGYYKEWNLGKISCAGNYSLGKKEGAWFYMDLIGDTIRVENWLSGKIFGEQIKYYASTKLREKPPIYEYLFVDLEGKSLFKMVLDTHGKITELKGFPLYCAFNKNNIKKDDFYELMCFFGVPPQLSFNLIITETNLKNKRIISQNEFNNGSTSSTLENLNFGKKIKIEKKYLSPGDYNWKINLSLLIVSITKL